MTYRFQPLPELYWGVAIAAALVLLQALVTLDPEAVTDWRTWAVALGGGMVRAAAGAALDYLRRSMAAPPDPPPDPPAVLNAATDFTEHAYLVTHKECGRGAFVALVPPAAGLDLRSDRARHLDGSPIVAADPVRCDSCGDELIGIEAERGRWVAYGQPRLLGAG